MNDLLSLKPEVLPTRRPRQRCLVAKETLDFTAEYLTRNRTGVLSVIPLRKKCACSTSKGKADNLYIHRCTPEFCQIPFIGSHNINDIYTIFSFEPMHTLHFGVSKMLKEWALEKFQDLALKTKSLFPGTTERRFPSIWREVIAQLNTFQYSLEELCTL